MNELMIPAPAGTINRRSLTGNKCLCRGCGRYFGGVVGFDLHRRAGRCVDPLAVGLKLASDGFYRQPPPCGVGHLRTIYPGVMYAAGAAP